MMSGPSEFWSWFAEHEARLRDVDGPRKEAILDEVLEHLHRCCTQLWIEIGGRPDGPRELIISAGGDSRYFGEVEAFVAAAPSVPGWNVVALKPAMGFGFVTTYGGLSLDPRQMWFLPLDSPRDPSLLGLRITGSSYDVETHDDYLNACFVVLDCALGEADFAREVHHIEVCPMPPGLENEGWIELVELARFIAWRKQKRAAGD